MRSLAVWAPTTRTEVVPQRFQRSVPWRVGDLLLFYGCIAVGLCVIGIAWFGASNSVVVTSQLRWTNIGVGGLIVLGAGMLAWILAGRRAVGELRRHVLDFIEVPDAAPPVHAFAADGAERGTSVVSAPGMRHYHRPHCVFVAGKQVKTSTESAFRRQKLTPCRGCLA